MNDDPSDPLGSKAWAQFGKKLLDVAKSGIGAISYKWLVVRDAKAYVEAAKILALGERDVRAIRALPPPTPKALPATSSAESEDTITVDWEEPAPLAERAHERLGYQEQKRQLNTEKVLHHASQSYDGGAVSEMPVDEDWIARFFTAVQDISSEEMQKVWATILAKEVQQPGNFSLRTLEVLRNLTSHEAFVFARLATYSCEGRVFSEPLDMHRGLTFNDIITLQDAQLVGAVQLGSTPILSQNEKEPFVMKLFFKSTALFITREHPPVFPMPIWKLTGPGAELAPIARYPDDLRFIACVASIYESHGFAVEARECRWDGAVPFTSDIAVKLPSPEPQTNPQAATRDAAPSLVASNASAPRMRITPWTAYRSRGATLEHRASWLGSSRSSPRARAAARRGAAFRRATFERSSAPGRARRARADTSSTSPGRRTRGREPSQRGGACTQRGARPRRRCDSRIASSS